MNVPTLVIVQGQLHSVFKKESFQKSGGEMGSTRKKEEKGGTKWTMRLKNIKYTLLTLFFFSH